MHGNLAPNSSSSRDKDKERKKKRRKKTVSRGKNLASLFPSFCTTGMAALKPTGVEAKAIELAQRGLFCRTGWRKSHLMTHYCVFVEHMYSTSTFGVRRWAARNKAKLAQSFSITWVGSARGHSSRNGKAFYNYRSTESIQFVDWIHCSVVIITRCMIGMNYLMEFWGEW